ncbi:MAG: hypothetical protein B6I34_08910 [Anaerolineaceae bacterium 4572_32.1]|nr:MAG: hypothetical protein B6I34_08910 [Anaerolineaceae bacterium 4572_32.1]
MNWRRVLSVMRKEWWHITRDRISFILLLLSPVLSLVTMAYAFSIDITDVGIGVMDQDLSRLSRQFLNQLGSTDALRLEALPQNLDEVERLMMRGTVKAVVIIPHGFAQDLKGYNPSLKFTVSMIPALVGIVLSVPAMAASLALAREREWGTLEGLIVTPIGRAELLIGKLIPYVLAGTLSVPLCVATAVYGFDVPFRGNLWLYLALSVLFLFATMSIALLLSVFTKSQQVAIIGSMIIFLFSGFFMSGLLIPMAIMGPALKMEGYMFPTTHFVIISRGIFVKGIGLAELQGYVVVLAVIGVMFLGLTALMFKKKL